MFTNDLFEALDEEFERRKRASQRNIEEEARKGDELGSEIEERKREMNELRRTMQRTEKELTARLNEIDENKNKLKTLKESLDKQDADIEVELIKIKNECELKEKEYKASLGKLIISFYFRIRLFFVDNFIIKKYI